MASARIVGGEDAPDGGFPYQCSVQKYSWKHICGCAIISDKWVLTASHCVKGHAPASLDILVGTNDVKNGGTYYRVDEFYTHEDFNHPMYANDIAVIRINRTFEFNDRVRPIAPAFNEANDGEEVTLTGWGNLEFRGPRPKRLQMIKLKALSTKSCQQVPSVRDHVHASHMCTFTRVGEGACNGDSGGPLVKNNKVVGVVNFGKQYVKFKMDFMRNFGFKLLYQFF